MKLELARENPRSAVASNFSFFDNYSLGGAATNTTSVPSSVHGDTLASLAQKVADLERAKNRSTLRGEITVVFKDKVFTSRRDVCAAFIKSSALTEVVRPLFQACYSCFHQSLSKSLCTLWQSILF